MESSNKSSTSIKNWAIDDRPREKLLTKGRESLSDSELLAILLSTGSKNKSAVELAKEILALGKNNLNELGKVSLKRINDYKRNRGSKSYHTKRSIGIGTQAPGKFFF